MDINNIITLLLHYMKFKKATEEEYNQLKVFVSKSNIFKGKRKKLYSKINKFKNIKKHN